MIVTGAKVKCTCGNKVSNMQLFQTHGVFITGIPAFNVSNKQVAEIGMEFGHCAKTNGKCVPNIVGEWHDVKDDVKVNGKPMIVMDSWLACSRQGRIMMQDSGQKNK